MANNALPVLAVGAAALLLLSGKKKASKKAAEPSAPDEPDHPLIGITQQQTPESDRPLSTRGATRLRSR